MAIEEMYTQFPVTPAAQFSDIILAVQGYSSPTVLGLSVQETWQQVFNLFQSNFILYNAGNPNGSVAGTQYQTLCWDSTNMILYICVSTGSATSAVWDKVVTLSAGSGITITQSSNIISISASGMGTAWNSTTGATQAMVTNSGYQANYAASLATYTLPTTSSFGDVLYVMGGSSSGWTVTQAANQQIVIGSVASTVGIGGSVSSSRASDGMQLVCTTANLIWQNPVAPQGVLSIV